jgi:predicted nucleic acid-binding Zn ribbon protein
MFIVREVGRGPDQGAPHSLSQPLPHRAAARRRNSSAPGPWACQVGERHLDNNVVPIRREKDKQRIDNKPSC